MLFNNGFRLPRAGRGVPRPASDVSDDKTAVESAGKNDELFKSLRDVEDQVDAIVKSCTQNYIDGIKENIVRLVLNWFKDEKKTDRFFFLFGNMGTGKSFFSSHVYNKAMCEVGTYPPVIYSSQQSYQSTTSVEKMLLVIARRLFAAVPEYAAHCREHELADKSIARLVENVLVTPLENKTVAKRVLVVIDGLDEYSRDECVELLDALNLYKSRINQSVSILFTSRPETYVRSHLPSHAPTSEYTIENMAEDSAADCRAFIAAKCASLSLELSEASRELLIEKSGFCLKYLKCVFDDVEASAVEIKDGMIESLPTGLLSYYREQLIRYFTDDRAYREEFRPFLEVICAAYRPLTVNEAADILGTSVSNINSLILRAGTLIYKSGNVVYLYQSESIKPYLSDERYCPENYLVSPENGSRRILQHLSELIEDDDLTSNEYLMTYAPNHILDLAAENDNEAWALLFKLVDANKYHRDLFDNIAKCIFAKPERVWARFMRKLYQNENLHPIVKDSLSSSTYLMSKSMQLANQFIDVVAGLGGTADFRYLEMLFRTRFAKDNGDYTEAVGYAEEMLQYIEASCEGGTTIESYRYGFAYDELQRIYRFIDAHYTVINEYVCKTLEYTQSTLDSTPKHSDIYPIVLRSHVVTLDQLGRTFYYYESKLFSTAERIEIAEALCPIIKVGVEGAAQRGFFIKQAILCHEINLDYSKRLQAMDPSSKFRLYDIHYPLLALGRAHRDRANPWRNLDKAIKYLLDCLNICEQLAGECAKQQKISSSEEKYLSCPINICIELKNIYLERGDYDKCYEYISCRRRYAEVLRNRFPDAENTGLVLATYLDEADIKRRTEGIRNALHSYLDVAMRYIDAAKELDSAHLYHSAGRIYDLVADVLSEEGSLEEEIDLRRKSVDIDRRVFEANPNERYEFCLYVDTEALAKTLLKAKAPELCEEGVALYREVIKGYSSLAQRYPCEKYERSPLSSHDALFAYYLRLGDVEHAVGINNSEKELAESLYSRYPNVKNAVSVVITYQHDAKVLIAGLGITAAEAECRKIAERCASYGEIWDDENVMCSPGIVYEYMMNAFAREKNYDKECEYILLSIAVDNKISTSKNNDKFERIACKETERYIEQVQKSSTPPDEEELARMKLELARRYNALGKRTQNIEDYRPVFNICENLAERALKLLNYDAAAEYVAVARESVEAMRQLKEEFFSDAALDRIFEFESLIDYELSGKGKNVSLFEATMDKYISTAYKWKRTYSVKGALRSNLHILKALGDDCTYDELLPFFNKRREFIERFIDLELDASVRSTTERFFFGELVIEGEILSKYDNPTVDATVLMAEELALSICLSMSERGEFDEDARKKLNVAQKRVGVIFGESMIMLKHLTSQKEPNKDKLIYHLIISLRTMDYFSYLMPAEDYKETYGARRKEVYDLLCAIAPDAAKDFEI